jgi:hypothetical protein
MATNDKIVMVSFMTGVCLKDFPLLSSHDTNATRSPDCVSQVHIARARTTRTDEYKDPIERWQLATAQLCFSVIGQYSLLPQTTTATTTMPVIPVGLEPFEILSPVAASDDGQPTNNLLLDAERVFRLIQDERHLTAEDLLNSVQERLDEATRATAAGLNAKGRTSVFHSANNKAARSAKNARERSQHEIVRVRELLETKAASIDKLKVRRCLRV